MERIRTATENDAVRLAEIEVFCYRLHFYPIFRTDRYFFSELNVETVAAEYHADAQRVNNTAVYDDGIVKGFVRVNGGEIEKLFVEPAFHGQGIGAALLRYATDTLGGSCLLVLEKNARAIRFYQRHGFVLTDRKQRVDDTKEYLVRMEKTE